MADPMIFQFIGETVTNATDAFVAPAAGNLIMALQGVALTGISLYFTLTAYAIMTGAVQAPFWTFIKQVLKIAIITTFALTADGYLNSVLETLKGLETGLADAMNTSGTPAANIYEVFDKSLGKGEEIVATCLEHSAEGSWGFDLGWLICALVVMIGTAVVTIIGASVLIVAKFSLAIVFALGPIFIFSLMFPMTAKFFDSWFAQVLNYIIVIVVMAVVMTFAMSAYEAVIAASDFSGSGDDNPMFAALQIGILTGILSWISYQAGTIASGLAGGLSMAALTLRQITAPLRGATNMANRMLNPTSNRLDPTTGLQTQSSRLEHLAMGRSLIARNPAYRRAVVERMKNSWRKPGGSIKGK